MKSRREVYPTPSSAWCGWSRVVRADRRSRVAKAKRTVRHLFAPLLKTLPREVDARGRRAGAGARGCWPRWREETVVTAPGEDPGGGERAGAAVQRELPPAELREEIRAFNLKCVDEGILSFKTKGGVMLQSGDDGEAYREYRDANK